MSSAIVVAVTVAQSWDRVINAKRPFNLRVEEARFRSSCRC
jgi:hypothetical protein